MSTESQCADAEATQAAIKRLSEELQAHVLTLICKHALTAQITSMELEQMQAEVRDAVSNGFYRSITEAQDTIESFDDGFRKQHASVGRTC